MPDRSLTLAERRARRLRRLIGSAERGGAERVFLARTLALGAIALYFVAVLPWKLPILYPLGSVAAFMALGYAQYLLARAQRPLPGIRYVMTTFDVVLLCIILVTPNPLDPESPPAAVLIRSGESFFYLLVFVALAALSLSPRLVLWTAAVLALGWGGVVAWVATRPGAMTWSFGRDPESLPLGRRLAIYLDPRFVDLEGQAAHIVVALVIAGILAAAVARSRRILEEHARIERERGNLARYFSPNVVDELAEADDPFGPVRRQDVAVLFVDIVGFTSYAEDRPPEQVIGRLRKFQRLMEGAVFDHGGTLDKYIGDAVMATFGVPRPTGRDAANAILCARAMIQRLAEWNRQRTAADRDPVDARVSVHYGPVVLGAVGSERSLGYAVIGDTTNTAGRLQALTRDLDAAVALSQDAVAAAEREGGADLSGFVDRGERAIRGREGRIRVWTLARDAAH